MKTVALVCVLLAAALADELPDHCFRRCSGVAHEWMVGDHTGGDGEGMVKVHVDLTACGFTSPPHLSTSLTGKNHNIQTMGTASGVRALSATGFHLNVYKDKDSFEINPSVAEKNNWELYWTAEGYGC